MKTLVRKTICHTRGYWLGAIHYMLDLYVATFKAIGTEKPSKESFIVTEDNKFIILEND